MQSAAGRRAIVFVQARCPDVKRGAPVFDAKPQILCQPRTPDRAGVRVPEMWVPLPNPRPTGGLDRRLPRYLGPYNGTPCASYPEHVFRSPALLCVYSSRLSSREPSIATDGNQELPTVDKPDKIPPTTNSSILPIG
jgi:hypothetical protein